MGDDADALLQRASRARAEGRAADAKRDVMDAIERWRGLGQPLAMARALEALGRLDRDAGERDEARRHYEAAAEAFRSEGDRAGMAHAIRHIADIHADEGKDGLAEPRYREALERYREHPAALPLDVANAMRGLALVRIRAGDAAEARSLWERARSIYGAIGVAEGVAESERHISGLAEGGAD